jgi:hypothetical protein
MREVHRFISHLDWPDSRWLALCLIPPDAQSPEHRFLTLDRLPRFLSYMRYRNAQHWGVYITPSALKPHARNRRKESFEDQQMTVYLDCDHAQCLTHIQHRYPYPTLVVRTSPGRYQVYWRLDQAVTVVQQETLMSAMAIDVGADRAATDVSRVLRLPGFWNRKPGRSNTVEIVFNRQEAVPYECLLDRVSSSCARQSVASMQRSTAGAGAGVSAGRGCSKGISPSERDWYEVHRRLDLGHPAEQIAAWLQTQRSDKPRPRYYAELTVRKAVASRDRDKA